MKPKKVVILAYNFPPFIRAASLRTFSWFDKFSRDIDVTVITRKWENGKVYNQQNYFCEDIGDIELKIVDDRKRIIYVPNKYNLFFRIKNSPITKSLKINKLFTLLELLFKWNFVSLDNERSIYLEARKYILNNEVDFVIASGEPFCLFKYCYKINKEFGTQYLLDYRDSWTSNFSRKYDDSLIRKLILSIEKEVEKKYQRSATGISAISETLLRQVYPIRNSNSKAEGIVVPNGIYLEKFSNITPFDEFSEKFTILFVGTLYKNHKLEYLINSIIEILDSSPEKQIQLVLIGSTLNCSSEQALLLNKLKESHPKSLETIKYLSNNETIAMEKSASILVKFNALPQAKDHFGKKLYEYAASGRKVISIDCIPNMKHEEIFFEQKPFQYLAKNQSDVKRLINGFYDKWFKNELLGNGITIDDLEPFDTSIQTKKLETFIAQKIPHITAGDLLLAKD